MGICCAELLTNTKLTCIQQLHLLQNELSSIVNDNESAQEYIDLEFQIQMLTADWFATQEHHAKSRFTSVRDTSSRGFFRSVKPALPKHFFSSIQRNDNILISSELEIHDVIIDFFRDLYASRDTSLLDKLEISHFIPHSISNENSSIMGAIPSEEELQNILEHLPSYKVCGTNGIPNEFFQFFAVECAPLFHALINEITFHKFCPSTFYESTIILLHKKNDKSDICNWHPVSLLNSDAKIFSTFLDLCLKPFLNNVLSPSQGAFRPGFSIAEKTWMLDTFLTSCDHFDVSGSLINIDQFHAYDCLE